MLNPPQSWAILTPEYPPYVGGVGDYTSLVAEGLARAGEHVHIWSPDPEKRGLAAPRFASVGVSALPDKYSGPSLRLLDRALGELSKPILLLQYVPHGFGYKAMNLPFVRWFAKRPERKFVMFHEVVFAFEPRQALRHKLLAAVTHLMARQLAHAATQTFVSIPAWGEVLKRIAPRARAPIWLPVPSTIPTQCNADKSASRRHLGLANERFVFAHFGTYGALLSERLHKIVPPLLSATQADFLCIGSGGQQFRASLLENYPALAPRVFAPGSSSSAELAAQLCAADLLLYPYPDGVSCRRTSLLAALALGLPIVATEGHLSEGFWRDTQAVALVPAEDAPQFIAEALRLQAAPAAAARLAEHALLLYKSRFGVDKTLDVLLDTSQKLR